MVLKRALIFVGDTFVFLAGGVCGFALGVYSVAVVLVTDTSPTAEVTDLANLPVVAYPGIAIAGILMAILLRKAAERIPD